MAQNMVTCKTGGGKPKGVVHSSRKKWSFKNTLKKVYIYLKKKRLRVFASKNVPLMRMTSAFLLVDVT